MASQFFKRVTTILDSESITYDKAVVAELITKHVPDWRRVLNELQRYSATGSIDSGILVNLTDDSIKRLIGHLKGRNFNEVRKWVTENIGSDSTTIFRKFYDVAHTFAKSNTIPTLVLLINKYQYQSAFVADQEVNLVAFLTECMIDVEYI